GRCAKEAGIVAFSRLSRSLTLPSDDGRTPYGLVIIKRWRANALSSQTQNGGHDVPTFQRNAYDSVPYGVFRRGRRGSGGRHGPRFPLAGGGWQHLSAVRLSRQTGGGAGL